MRKQIAFWNSVVFFVTIFGGGLLFAFGYDVRDPFLITLTTCFLVGLVTSDGTGTPDVW